jgi:hypothetical protein
MTTATAATAAATASAPASHARRRRFRGDAGTTLMPLDSTIHGVVRFLTILMVALAFSGIAASATSAHSSFVIRRVVFVAISGHGRVTSVPSGITCPRVCRSAAFRKDETVRLVAHPAPGWTLARWSGSCTGRGRTCTFALTDAHDCAAGSCPIGAYGERIAFVRQGGQ